MVRGRRNPLYFGFAKRLRKGRKQAGLTATRLALQAGLANDAVRHLEDGDRLPGIDTVERLANVLRISASYLAFGHERPLTASAGLQSKAAGLRLRAVRTAEGLSRLSLAALAGLSGTTVSHIEEGRRIARVDTIESLAAALGVAPGWLAYGEGVGPAIVVDTLSTTLPPSTS